MSNKKKKKNLPRFIVLFLSILLIILGFIFKSNEEISEWFSKTITRFWFASIGRFSSIFPFSLSDVLIVLLVLLGIFVLVFCIIKHNKSYLNKRKKYLVIDYLITILFIFSTSIFISSPCFNRQQINISMYQNEITNDQVLYVTKTFINDFNELNKNLNKREDGSVKSEYTTKELNTLINLEYKKLTDDYFSKYTPEVKNSFLSPLLSEMGVTGYEFAFLGECSVNKLIPDVDIPFTIAHEIAHSKSVMRENEANLLATYICLTSDNEFIRYSGYFRGLNSIMNAAYYTRSLTDYKKIYKELSDGVLTEIENYSNYFDEHDSLDKIQTFFNDIYLKLNGIEEGTESYKDPAEQYKTGETYDDGSPVYKIDFSNTQKVIFDLYL